MSIMRLFFFVSACFICSWSRWQTQCQLVIIIMIIFPLLLCKNEWKGSLRISDHLKRPSLTSMSSTECSPHVKQVDSGLWFTLCWHLVSACQPQHQRSDSRTWLYFSPGAEVGDKGRSSREGRISANAKSDATVAFHASAPWVLWVITCLSVWCSQCKWWNCSAHCI